MLPRIARLVALALPLFLACVLALAGLRLHGGRVETTTQVWGHATSPAVAAPTGPSAIGQDLRHQLTMSVPWPAFAALLVLCLLPAAASLLAWSGSRRSRGAAYSVSTGAR